MRESLRINRANWDDRAPVHSASPDYAVDRFIADPEHISDVVAFDRPRLGDVSGRHTVHLQCHIGTDTISLHRLGARVTGLDFSPASLDQARALVARAGAGDVRFVESDVYGALDVLPAGGFDLVYTGIGALCWLPDIVGWAGVVAALLRPGGRLFVRDRHPMLASVRRDPEGRISPRDSYFERPEPVVWDDPGTYASAADAMPLVATVSHNWSHGLGETITALLDAGMTITGLTEHDSVPWPFLAGHTTRDAHGEWHLIERPERLAASFTLQARRA